MFPLRYVLWLTVAVFITLASVGATVAQTVPERQLERNESISALPSGNKRWALLIGIDKYQDSNISRLSGAANDANSLREALVKYAGFPRDQVVVLSTEEPPERQPTRSNILKRLSNLSSLVPDDGLLLFSFAGHGIERDGQAFLISSDATFTDDLGLLEDTAISVNQIKKRIKEAQIRQVIILLDACRSYPTGRSDSSNPLTAAFTRAFDFSRSNQEVTAFAVLYATAVGHRAYEYVEKRQGYFSWGIVQALSGAAANERGEVTLRALVKYLEDKVPKLVAMDYGPKMVQKPFAEIEGYRADEMIIATPSSVGGTPDPERHPSIPDSETELWDSIKASTNPRDFQDYNRKYPNGLFVEVAADRLNQLKIAPAPVNDTSHSANYGINLGTRRGKVLLSRTYLRREGQLSDPVIDEREFLTPLIQALKQVSLDITEEWTIDEKSRSQVSGAVREIKNGQKVPARSTEYAVNVEAAISVKDLPPYSELKIAMANITLRAIDLDRGEIVAIQNLDARGFGNEQSQATTNALKEAGQQIPKEFINRVAERAGVVIQRP